MDKNLSKSVKILISEQITLATMFYFQQVFVFRMFNVNQEKRFEMVSTNSMQRTYSAQIYKPF